MARCLTGSNQRLDAATETLIPCLGGFFDGGVTHTLRAERFDASEDGTGRGIPLVTTLPINLQVALRHEAMGEGTGMGIGEAGDPAYTLGANHSHAVAFDLRGRDGGAQFEGPHETANIRAASGGSSRSYVAPMAVRRLTPRECERLQGFPDDYTLISPKTPDGSRYKTLGNSMAVPVMRWLGERIQMVDGRIKNVTL